MPIIQATGIASGDSFICGIGSTNVLVTYRYLPGSILYPAYLAAQGILEAVCIKNVRLTRSVSTLNSIIMYRDTFNRLWNESDLLILSDARNLAIQYYTNIQAAILQELQQCGI